MSDLTAIDILVNPDDATLDHARAWNARMRESVPDGFQLDATHQPHITTLQRYVRTADLDAALAAVAGTWEVTDTAALGYQAIAVRHAAWGVPGQGLAAILIRPSPPVLAFQAALLAAVTPYVGSGGTADAFVTDPGEQLTQSTFDWVDGYVPHQIGDGYTPHITVGFATDEALERMEAEPFEAFAVQPLSLAVYQLGNNGTARRLLQSWPVDSARWT
jgi:hypothetical protein